MLRLLLLLSLSSLLLFQGSNALCVPRDSHFKARKQTPSRSQSSGSSPANAPAKPPPSQSQSSGSSPVKSPANPPPSTPSPVNAPAKPPPSTPSPINAPTKPSPSPPSPVEEPTKLSSESVPSPVNAPTKPTGSKPSGSVPSHAGAAHAPGTNSGSRASGVDASVAGFCKQTNYPDVCVSSVKPYLPASGHVSPADMLLMQIKATATKVGSATAHANQLLAGPTITPYLRSCLETCKDLYDDMNANFDDAKKALAMSDLDTLKTMLSATISDASTCEDGFLEMPGVPMLMGSYDSELSKLTSNCLALADLV